MLEGKSKLSHTVHSPYFTDDKQEYWWAYVCDRKKRTLITAPYQVFIIIIGSWVGDTLPFILSLGILMHALGLGLDCVSLRETMSLLITLNIRGING